MTFNALLTIPFTIVHNKKTIIIIPNYNFLITYFVFVSPPAPLLFSYCLVEWWWCDVMMYDPVRFLACVCSCFVELCCLSFVTGNLVITFHGLYFYVLLLKKQYLIVHICWDLGQRTNIFAFSSCLSVEQVETLHWSNIALWTRYWFNVSHAHNDRQTRLHVLLV